MEKGPARLEVLAARNERFAFDLRSECSIYSGVVVAYRGTTDARSTDLEAVVAHALEHDGIVSGYPDAEDHRMCFESCRLFTDTEGALRFAAAQGQVSVFNLNREREVPVR